jgi:hypothetical protein
MKRTLPTAAEGCAQHDVKITTPADIANLAVQALLKSAAAAEM